MHITRTLTRLKTIRQPILVDGGSWQSGHDYFILTDRGVYKKKCITYYPIWGPILVYKKRHLEIIKRISRKKDNIKYLDKEEQLFLMHSGKPDRAYWAFQPFEGAPLEEWIFSSDYKEIETAFIKSIINHNEPEDWDLMDEKTLNEWVEKIE